MSKIDPEYKDKWNKLGMQYYQLSLPSKFLLTAETIMNNHILQLWQDVSKFRILDSTPKEPE